MRTSDLFRSALRNVRRSRLRTTLTVLALVVGAFTLSLTTALGAGVSDYVTRQVDALGADDVLVVTAASPRDGDGPTPYDPTRSTAAGGGTGLPGAGAPASLTDESLTALRGIEGLSDVRPVRSVALDHVQAGGSQRYELSLSPTGAVAQADLVAGQQLDAAGVEDGIVLPQDYVGPLGLGTDAAAVGRPVTLTLTDLTGTQQQVPATVVGVSRSGLLSSGAAVGADFLDDLARVQDAGVGAPGRYQAATARFDPASAAGRDGAATLETDVTAIGLQARTIADQLGVVTTVITGITGVLNAFAVVSLIAAAFGIVNTLLMSVQERTREIGLVKALGMAPRRVFALFSLEAALIGLLGSLVGVALAAAAGTAISAALAAGPLSGLPGLTLLLFQPRAVVLVVVLIVVIAFLAGTLPARRAARQDPITALRYE